MTLRSFVFWPHLVSGVLAGTVVLTMSVTGVLLTYEKQMIARADASVRLSGAAADRLPPEALIARVAAEHAAVPVAVVMPAAPEKPALVTVRQTVHLVDPYSGATLGASAPRLRAFFRTVTDVHRWLAVQGEARAGARAVTGWANFLFLLMVLSGIYLWWPRRWTRQHVKAVAVLNPKLSGKARDFNWHNAIGVWCAVPLFFVVLGAIPISFPWATALVYRAVGETPPAAAPARTGAGPAQPAGAPLVNLPGLNDAWEKAEAQVEGWRTVTLRVPTAARAPFVFTIDRGSAGQPQHRGTLTIPRDGSGALSWEPFQAQSRGRRIRTFLRFLHTGEVFGIAGQTVAGLASLGAVFLVWTGLALSWRRFVGGKRKPEDQRARVAA
jgi:uncharacterized iron-regulated membrane protein